jgi:hypothetical protein
MKPTAIERNIRHKVNDWLESIDDEKLRELVKDNVVVTGGCITSMLLEEKPNDYDIYFKTYVVATQVAEYYVQKFCAEKCNTVRFAGQERVTGITVKVEDGHPKIYVKSAGVAREGGAEEYQYFEMIGDDDTREQVVDDYMIAAITVQAPLDVKEKLKPYRPQFLTSNAITLTDGIQLVIRFAGTSSVLHENFDFTHCKNHWSSWKKPGKALQLLKMPVICTLNKRIHYSPGSLYPLASLFRTRKFIKRGWDVSLGEYLKIVYDIAKLNLNDPKVLQDQLIGMDAAYFAEIITALREGKVEKVDAAYLARIIDELY